LNNIKKLVGFFFKKDSVSAPLLIIKKDVDDINVKEYKSIEEAITDLENDPNVPTYKIEKLKSSLKDLKNKTSIQIRNGELIK
jgi:polyhydroxyalkanoate synthesis regulator phasin